MFVVILSFTWPDLVRMYHHIQKRMISKRAGQTVRDLDSHVTVMTAVADIALDGRQEAPVARPSPQSMTDMNFEVAG